jgi:hypothetical protein
MRRALFIRKITELQSGTDKTIDEWTSYSIFNTEGFTSTDLVIKEKATLKPYVNTVNNVSIPNIDINNLSNVTLKLGLWNGSQYATPPTYDSFKIRFSNQPSDVLQYNSYTSLISSGPNLNPDIVVQAVSKLWSLKTKSKQTSKNLDTIVINSEESSPAVKYFINKDRIFNNIVYPRGATPGYIYIKNVKPRLLAAIGYVEDSSSFSGYGGMTYDPTIHSFIYVPSSPNIRVSVVGDSTTADQYFSNISYPYSATPSSISLELVDGGNYPVKVLNWTPFIALSDRISGYIDEHGYVGYKNKDGEFVPSKNSDTIIIPEITRETFGISGSSKFQYYFESISIIDPADTDVLIWSEQKIIAPFLNKNYVLKANNINSIINDPLYASKNINYPTNSIKETYNSERNTTVFTNFIARGRLYDAKLEARVNTGWLHVDNDEYYVFAKPKKEKFTGKLKEISLSSVAESGAPICLNVFKSDESTPHINYIETAFVDYATPRQFGFYNKENIKPSFDDSFYLSYFDVYGAKIVDGVTGKTLFEDLASDTNILSVDSSTPIFNPNRNYEITYRVKNSYYVDNVISGPLQYSKLVFDATPSTPLVYEITYEMDKYEQSTPIGINFGETSSLLDSGYVIASAKEYPFKKAQVKISPHNLMDDGKDFITISIISLDTNNNPKPFQTFILSDDHLNFSSKVVKTNEEGYAIVTATYSAATPIQGKLKGLIRIIGAESTSTPGYWQFDREYPYSINSSYKQKNHSISTAADPSVVKADGVSSVYIDGVAESNNIPQKNAVIYWRKARTPHAALEAQEYSSSSNFSGYSGIVLTDNNGRFSIGPIVSQSRSNPGYWYVVAESEFKNTYSSQATPVAGDISYWYESYDNVDLNYVSDLKMVDVVNFNNQESLNIYSTPSFITSYYDEQLVSYSGATPRWIPPTWLPTSRYEQYQAGFLGSTPYFISEYRNLKKDYQ